MFDRKALKDIIACTECRFRQVLVTLRIATPQYQKWMLETLLKELHFILGCIGYASALGQPAHIPFIITLLTRELIPLGPTGEGFIFTPELLDLLDAGPLCSVPTSYLYKWWLGHAMPKDEEIMGVSTIEVIMEHYYSDKKKYIPKGHLDTSCPPATKWSNETEQALLAVPHEVRQHLMHANMDMRKLIMLSQRRASGFYQLWEAALRKEEENYSFAPANAAGSAHLTVDPSSASHGAGRTARKPVALLTIGRKQGESSRSLRSAGKKRQLIVEHIPKRRTNGELANMFSEFSARELDRMPHTPAVKWTWGVDLTEVDIARLVRAADNDFRIPHSDYDASLPMGRLPGSYSTEEAVHLEDSFSHTTIHQSDVPDLTLDDVPTHFSRFPLRRTRSNPLEGLEIGSAAETLSPEFSGISQPAAIQLDASITPRNGDESLTTFTRGFLHDRASAIDATASNTSKTNATLALPHDATQARLNPVAEHIPSFDDSLLQLAETALTPSFKNLTALIPAERDAADLQFDEMLHLAELAVGNELSLNPASDTSELNMLALANMPLQPGVAPELDLLVLADFALQRVAASATELNSVHPLTLSPTSLPHSSHNKESHMQEAEMLQLASLALGTSHLSGDQLMANAEDAQEDLEYSDESESDHSDLPG